MMKLEDQASVSPASSSYAEDDSTTPVSGNRKFTIKYKRPRSTRACVTCHDRKVRCDLQFKIPCSNCVSFHCECVLPSTKRVRRTKKEILEERLKDSIPDRTDSLNKILSSVDLKKSSRDYKLLVERPKSDLLFLGSSAVLSSSKHYKRSMETSTISDLDLKILSMNGCLHLPSEEICHELIDLYFLHVHPFTPVLNRTQFMLQYYDHLSDPPCLALLNSVLLAGSRFSKNPLLQDEKGSVDKASQILYRRVKTFYDIRVNCKPVEMVQLLTILASYWEGPDDVTQNIFYWTRVAISLAQGYGFHKSNNYWTESDSKIWKKCWWTLFCRDRTVALSFGRSIVIDLEDCDVPMLTIEDFEEDWDGEGENPANLKMIERHYFINYIKICEIIGIVLKQKYTVQAEKTVDHNHLAFIKKCDLLMVNWLNNLPPDLQYSLTNPEKQSLSSALIMCHYYVTLSLIHRTNILRRSLSTSSQDYYPSWGITFQSSHMIAIICKNIMDRDELEYCPAFIVTVLFSALIMLIYHIDNKNAKVSSTLKKLLDICSKLLLVVSKTYGVGYICLQMADTLRNDKIKRNSVIQNIFSSKQKLDDKIEPTNSDNIPNKNIEDFKPHQLFPTDLSGSGPTNHHNHPQQQQQQQQWQPLSLLSIPITATSSSSPGLLTEATTSGNTLRQQSTLSNLRNSPKSQYPNTSPSTGSDFSRTDLYDLPSYSNFEMFDSNLNFGVNEVFQGQSNGAAGNSNNANVNSGEGEAGNGSKGFNGDGDNNNAFLGEIPEVGTQPGTPPTGLNINDWFNFLQY